MDYDLGSYSNDEEPDDDIYQKFPDYLLSFDGDPQEGLFERLCHLDLFSDQNSNQDIFHNHSFQDQNHPTNVKDPPDPTCNDSLIKDSTSNLFLNKSAHINNNMRKNSLKGPPSFYTNNSSNDSTAYKPTIEECNNGPPYFNYSNGYNLSNASFVSNYSYTMLNSNFNKRNTASVVPIGINASILFQDQQNQYHGQQFLLNSCAAQSSKTDFNTKSLSKASFFGRGGKASSSRQNTDSEDFDKFLLLMVLQNQKKKVTMSLKIIIFNFFREYLKSTHPELNDKELRPLTRKDKRNCKLINDRLLLIKDFVIHNFEYNKKETLIPIVERYNEHILHKHAKKDRKSALINLKQIKKLIE